MEEKNIKSTEIEFEGFSYDNLKSEKHFEPIKPKEMNTNSKIKQNIKERSDINI